MHLQLQFKYDIFEIICMFSFNFNTKDEESCSWSNSTYGRSYPISSMKDNCCIFSCSFFDKVIAQLTLEFVFSGTQFSYCWLRSADVSGLVNLCITCNDIEVEIAYYVAVSHHPYFPTNLETKGTSILNRNIGGAFKTLY